MRKPVSNHLRILLYREIPSLMNRTSKRMPPRRFVTPRSDGIFRARIRSRIRTYAQNVYNAIHFHLYTWLEYRRCAWAMGKEGERRMIRFRIRWHQANPRIGWRGIVRLDASWNTSNVQAHCLILTLVTRALCRRIFTSRITRFHREGFIIYNKTEAQIFFLELILNVVYEIRKKGGRERSFGSIIDEQTRGKGYLLLFVIRGCWKFWGILIFSFVQSFHKINIQQFLERIKLFISPIKIILKYNQFHSHIRKFLFVETAYRREIRYRHSLFSFFLLKYLKYIQIQNWDLSINSFLGSSPSLFLELTDKKR